MLTIQAVRWIVRFAILNNSVNVVINQADQNGRLAIDQPYVRCSGYKDAAQDLAESLRAELQVFWMKTWVSLPGIIKQQEKNPKSTERCGVPWWRHTTWAFAWWRNFLHGGGTVA